MPTTLHNDISTAGQPASQDDESDGVPRLGPTAPGSTMPCSPSLLTASAAWSLRAQVAAWGLIVLGAAARIREFAFARSLWIDEASAAISIASRDFAGLMQPLENSQTAPIGYIMLTEVSDVLFGPGEMSLRLLPLICGIAALVLFYRLAQSLMQPAEGLIALALMAMLNSMVYFSNEFKPYAVDAAATVALVLCGVGIAQHRPTWPRVAWFMVVATLSVWVSFTATLIVAAVGMPLIMGYWLRGEKAHSIRVAIACAVAAANFAANYLMFMRQLTGNPLMERVWSHLFMPIPPSPHWLVGRFIDFFSDPFAATFAGLAAAMLLLGVLWYWRHNRLLLAIALLPVLFTLAASALHLYPAGTRVLLFGMPLALLLVAGGLRYLLDLGREGRPIFAIIAALLLMHPCMERLEAMHAPFEKEEVRPVLKEIARHIQPGDTIYLHHNSWFQFSYYVTHSGLIPQLKTFEPIRGSNGRFNWHAYSNDLNNLRGKGRVWLVFFHIWKWNGVDEDRLFLMLLSQMGARPLPMDPTSTEVNPVTRPGAAAFLFDFSNAQPLTVPEVVPQP